jgi:hypothetical protein
MTEKEVKALLESWVSGNIDSYEWDYFISVKSKNPRLEAIRQECGEIWVSGSPYLETPHRITLTLSKLGVEKVRKLIAELESAT